MKQASYERSHTVRFHLDGIPRTDRSTETETTLVLALSRSSGERVGMWSDC